MIKLNSKLSEITDVLSLALRDVSLGRDAELARLHHNGSAMRIIGANVQALVTTHFLKPRPKIDLQILNQMAYVNRAIGVWQCGGGDYSTFLQWVLRRQRR